MGVVSGLDAFPDRSGLCGGVVVSCREQEAAEHQDAARDGAIQGGLAACARALLAADTAGPEDIAALVLESAGRLTASGTALVGRFDPDNGTLVALATAGAHWPESLSGTGAGSGDDEGPTTMIRPGGVIGRVVSERRSLVINKDDTDLPPPFNRILASPALDGEVLTGVICVAGAHHDYSSRDLGAIRQLADLYALALRRCLRDAERIRLSEAVEQAPVSVVLTDPSGTVRYVNPAFSRATGFTRDEALGQNPRLLKSGYTAPAEYQRLWATLAAGQVWRGEFHNKRKNNELFWEAAAVGPIRDQHGVLTGFVAIKDDITRRKAMEIDLLMAKEAAEDASQAKSTFLAHVSHELRTPLNAIIGFAEIMDRQLFGPVGDSHYRDYARYIGDSGRHLLALINDILDLSKVEAGRMDMVEEAVDMVAAMDTACTLLRTRAETGRVLLTANWIGPAPRLRADARMIRQILLNIVSNAVKFTPPDGRVTVTGQREADGNLVIIIADTGPGMSEIDLSVALAPFGQLRTLAPPAEGGSGLGLPLAKSLTELHGGSLTLASRPQAGTTVTIRFPADRVVRDDQP
jgi:PAS domain S-box-containing protein